MHACSSCTSWSSRYNNLHYTTNITKKNLEKKVESLKLQVEKLSSKVAELESDLWKRGNEKWVVENEICTSDLLGTEHFEIYYQSLLQKYPILQQMVHFFFSNYSMRKESSKKTSEEWHRCRSLYKSFILDTILKSRDKNALLRTHMMLGVVLMQYNMPDPAWRLLQRLRILPSRHVVEKYLRNQPEPTLPEEKFQFISLDNAEIKLHTTHMRTDHRTTMMKFLSCFILQIPRSLTIKTA